MEIQTRHYLAKNQHGETLFKIELANIESFPWLQFACTLDIDFDKHPGIRKTVEELCSPETTPDEKAMLIRKVMLQIKRIEGVESMYFKRRSDQSEPELKNGIQKFLDRIFAQNDFKEYVPFSKSHNPYFFSILKKKLAMPNQLNKMLEVDRGCFEDLIKGHIQLENEYVNYYAVDTTFYARVLRYDEINYEFYFMRVADEIKLIFFMENL